MSSINQSIVDIWQHTTRPVSGQMLDRLCLENRHLSRDNIQFLYRFDINNNPVEFMKFKLNGATSWDIGTKIDQNKLLAMHYSEDQLKLKLSLEILKSVSGFETLSIEKSSKPKNWFNLHIFGK